ncbi:MAG: class I adenylate-forming enzyme family protein, partial [Chloroflexota bacterium]
MQPFQTFPNLLARTIDRHAYDPVMTGEDDRPVTGRGLGRAAEQTSVSLRTRGIGREDRLGLVLDQDLDSAVTLACAMTVCAAVALPPATPAELDALLPRLRLRALLAPDGAEDAAIAAADRHDIPVLWRLPDPRGGIRIAGPAAGPAAPDRPARPEDTAVIILTSGSAGRPKLVPRTHRNTVDCAVASLPQQPLVPRDATILHAPIASSYAHEQLVRCLAIGGRLDLRGPFAPTRMSALLATCRPAWLALTPPMLAAWLDVPGAGPISPASRLRFIQVSGAPLTGSLRSAAAAAFGVPILDSYGSTEALAVAYEPVSGRCPAGTAGEPVAGVRIVDDTDTPLPDGSPGSIQVRGDTVFPGYLDDPDATARAFTADGWFRMGDRGIIGARRCLTVLGREDDLINRGGDKIDPAEVEAILLAHPAVSDCAVFAIPHPRFGQE